MDLFKRLITTLLLSCAFVAAAQKDVPEDPADKPLAKAILARAKTFTRTLTETEVAQVVRELRPEIRLP